MKLEFCIGDGSLSSSQPQDQQHRQKKEREVIAELWDPPDSTLLEQLKEEVIDGVFLARPDYDRRFYLKTDWNKDGIAAALCQADPNSPCSVAAEKSEDAGGP